MHLESIVSEYVTSNEWRYWTHWNVRSEGAEVAEIANRVQNPQFWLNRPDHNCAWVKRHLGSSQATLLIRWH